MAVNKNFVVKNGLEVNNNLILADATNDRVGIGTSVPQYTLHVFEGSGIGATSAYVTGITTVLNELRIGSGGTVFSVIAGPAGVGQSVGVGTARPGYLLDVRAPVSAGQTALYVQGDVRITGDLFVDDIEFDDASLSNLTVTDTLYVGNSPGISTFVGFTTFLNYVSIKEGLNVSGITTISNTTQSTTFNNGALVIDGGLGVEKNVNVGGNLDVTGNITIGGSFFSLQSQDVYISNKDIVLGYTTAIGPNDETANHAGVAIASTEGYPLVSFSASGINTLPDTYKQMMWFRSGTLGFSTDAFGFNYGLAIGTTTMANGVRLAVGSDIAITDTTINAINANISDRLNAGITSTKNFQATGVSTFVGFSTFNDYVFVQDGLISTGIITGTSFVPSSGYIKAPDGTNSFYIYSGTGNVAFQGTIGASQLNSASGNKVVGLAASDASFENNVTVAGITTLGRVKISTGIITASSGIVTYYGDGSNLTGTATGLTATIGVSSGGTTIGTGVTTINVVGTGFTADTSGTQANLYLPAPGVSLGLAIALGG